jgi:ABC-2 type transport system ATP-binding protein
LSDVEKICDKIAILDKGELICQGAIAALVGESQGYRVKIRGGNPDLLKQRVRNLKLQDGLWVGILKGDAQDFIASLRLMRAEMESIELAKPSLEEFFVQQIRDRGVA